MGREKVFCLPLRRFAWTSAAALIALVLAGAARAGTIQVFDVSGMAQNLSGMDLGDEDAFCSSSGKRTIHVRSATMFSLDRITAADITIPGQPDFNVLEAAGPVLRFEYWMFSAGNNASETLSLGFLPEPTQASLVDLDIGSLVGEFTIKGPAGNALYARLGGSITPEPESSPAPGPSSLALLGTGLIGLGALARRNLKRRTTASPQTARGRPVPVLVGAKWPSTDLQSNRLLKTIVCIEVSALYSVAQNRKNASGNVTERSAGSN